MAQIRATAKWKTCSAKESLPMTLFWRGKHVDSLTRDELLEALKEAHTELAVMRGIVKMNDMIAMSLTRGH